jgi:hypothetical protein
MTSATVWLACPACKSPKSAGFRPDTASTTCLACRKPVEALLLPRAFKPFSPPPLPSAPPALGDAVCFYDAAQKATCLCSQCGVLVSDSWSANWGNRKVCLRCLEKLRESGRDSNFESSRLMWDNICLLLSSTIFILIFPYFAIIAAPATIVLGIRTWNHPRSLVPRSRFRLIVALILASLQVLGMLVGIYFIIQALLDS